MRVVGIVLVVLGAVALGVYGFRHLGAAPAEAARAKGGWLASPVVAGIAVVGGLLMLASYGRRE